MGILAILFMVTARIQAQDRDSTAVLDRFSGQVLREGIQPSEPLLDHVSGSFSVTNNGISLIPSFSLGDPAAIFLGKFARKRFSVEPDIRFSLQGRPWTLLFWFRSQVQFNCINIQLAVAHLSVEVIDLLLFCRQETDSCCQMSRGGNS